MHSRSFLSFFFFFSSLKQDVALFGGANKAPHFSAGQCSLVLGSSGSSVCQHPSGNTLNCSWRWLLGVRASAADKQRTLCRFYETSKPAPALRLHQHPLLGKETLSLSRLIVRTIILQSPQPRLLLLTRGFVFSTPPRPPLMRQPQTRFTYRNHFKGNEWK